MNSPVPRTVQLIVPQDDERLGQEGLSLADFRSDHCYVLLGEPGLGKSTAFETEANQVGAPDPLSARRFMSRDLESHPNWRAGPLFVDGLDEVRAGRADPRSPLDKILARIETLGNPPFRLSCRTGSWLERGDQRELSSLTSEPIRVLQLNPLCRELVRQIVARRRDDADKFIVEAFEHGMDTFLWNPQLLAVLLDSVEASGWPDTPTEAFERACRELARERNIEHRDARRRIAQPSRDAVLSAAGELSALMLIAGKGGWTATDTDDPDILSLDEVEAENRDTLLAALESGLFRGSAAFRTPTHRLLAEFLGARFLAGRIQAHEGVTVRRALSLLMGHDAIPLPDLRGLAAWLAALNPDARGTLIQADPVAVAFDGDASGFTSDERTGLFERLEKSIELGRVWPSGVALGALAGDGDRSALWELTSSPKRSDARQHLVWLLLSGFSARTRRSDADDGIALDAESEADRQRLEGILRDATWRADVRCRALVALNRVLRDNPVGRTLLRGLLVEVKKGRLPDDANRLLGTMLDRMYPEDLPPAKIWDYLATSPAHGCHSYERFWLAVVDRSTDTHIRELLDSLCSCASEAIPRLERHGLEHVVLELLARGLEVFGDDTSSEALYAWFGLVEAGQERPGLVPAHCRDIVTRGFFDDAGDRIQAWLKSREGVRNSLILRGLAEHESEIGVQFLDGSVGDKFLGENPPEGFRQWCLVQATDLAGTQPRIAQELALWAVRQRPDWGPPVADEGIAQSVRGIPVLEDWNEDRLQARARWEREGVAWKERHAAFEARVRERQEEYGASVRKHAPELREGRCPPVVLHKLAQQYLEGLAEEGSGDAAVTRLRRQLGDDQALVDATLSGFRSLLDRDDLPDLDETVHLHETNQMSYFALPFLAGLAEGERAGTDPLDRLDPKQLRRALGYYFVSNLPGKHYSLPDDPRSETRPAWYLEALASHPAAVADALVAVHRARVRAKQSPEPHLWDLAFDPEYERVAALAVSRLLTVFPSRCSAPQCEALRVALWAALDARFMSAEALRQLVLRRLERRGMDVAQRAQWLCAGLFVARQQCLPELTDFLSSGSDVRVRHAVDFFGSHDRRMRIRIPAEAWRADELATLIRVVGSRLPRFVPPERAGFMGRDQAARLKFEPVMSAWINGLAGRTDEQAATALKSLISSPGLSAWSEELAHARDQQAARRRRAKHEAPDLASIQDTLRGGPPRSAADLVAVLLDALEQLAEHIRDGETNDWLQYWHRNRGSRRPTAPQHEDDCRDALLSDLKKVLRPDDLDAAPEGRYADDKRADIRVALGSGVAIPLELKKSTHREVWRSAEEQLIAKYTRAPESEGYGIYVVFWFGRDRTTVPPVGRLPKTSSELKERLEARLSPEQRAKISIVVIDVSPAGKYATAGP
ncbi:hypothetical protein [Candidatus Palauibacter sp.]|uniref:hypothetical protein n=1 Tax=Candidatus Palauibacter sp. TaxID=3101350 RepID=UPI003B52EA16